MSKSLVIVESPAKAKTIGKYLGKNYVVKASPWPRERSTQERHCGRCRKDFRPTYEVIEGKKKLIEELRKAAKDSDAVYLAADPDREGEAICYHLQEELQPKKGVGPAIYRVMFNEITSNAVKKAFDQPAGGQRGPGRRAAGAACPGPAGGIQDFPAAMGQGSARTVGGTRADRCAPADRRSRTGNPRLRQAGILVDRSRI